MMDIANDATSSARLASIIESSEDAIISKDLRGTILTWNRGASAIYGWSAEEVIGKSIDILLPPERLGEEDTILERLREGQRVEHYETVRIRKNGTPIHVSLTISPIRDGDRLIGASHVARDISDRKHLEGANAQLAAIVESSEDAIVSKDLNGIIQTWNAAAERIYGYRADEAIGKSMRLVLEESRAHEEEDILERIRRGDRVEHFETTRTRKGGKVIEVSLTISPIRDRTGAIIGASHIARDITERRKFDREMRQTQRLESLGVLAGGIAHDFNNLLTGIIGNASLIAEMLPGGHPAAPLLRDLTLAADRAADLTRQLLAYSGRGQFVIGPVNVSSLVEEVGTLLSASIPKNVDLRMDLDSDATTVEADRSQIQQLVMNLILNGAEAIEPGRQGTVLVRTGIQHAGASYLREAFPDKELSPGDYVFIEVRDNGSGMTEEVKARIFDPFFTTKFTGRGLGLAAATGIVSAHRGAIRVQSAPSQGSTFRVLLPALPPSGTGADQHRVSILVVDDEEIVRKVARATLQGNGYRVLVADNGREAVEIFREMGENIGLVILDVTMPVMNGEEALRHIRALRPDVPVILSSGYTEAEAMRQFDAGMIAGFLQKPYRGSQLREKVEANLPRPHRNGG